VSGNRHPFKKTTNDTYYYYYYVSAEEAKYNSSTASSSTVRSGNSTLLPQRPHLMLASQGSVLLFSNFLQTKLPLVMVLKAR